MECAVVNNEEEAELYGCGAVTSQFDEELVFAPGVDPGKAGKRGALLVSQVIHHRPLTLLGFGQVLPDDRQ